MRTIEIKLYQFDELSDDAKEKAREWWRKGFEFDGEHVIDTFVDVCNILGVELAYDNVPLMNGKTRRKPRIFYSGFYSQGDGACFEGTYRYKSDACERIREFNNEKLNDIADKLKEIQSRYNFELYAQVKHVGRSYHEHSTEIRVDCNDWDLDKEGNEVTVTVSNEDQKTVEELMRDLMRFLYDSLKSEHEYQLSDEVVDDDIRCNEYEFTEEGHRHG